MVHEIDFQIKRHNIYSCLSIQIEKKEICFDPAKIPLDDLPTISPDLILISHESMDHMDPIQVFQLQKKKGCPIICSIACYADLVQYFHQDIDFIENLTPLIPKASIQLKDIKISAGLSIHCDYMQPIVYRLDFIKSGGFSLLHCFDTHLSQEIVDLSKGTDVAIIPIGIAKGVSVETGAHFAKKLHSRYFVTNHFKDKAELAAFHNKINGEKNYEKFFLIDWNEKRSFKIPTTQNEITLESQTPSIELVCDIICTKGLLSSEHLMSFLLALSGKRAPLLTDAKLIEQLFNSYDRIDIPSKKVLLIIATIISLIDTHLISSEFLQLVQKELAKPSVEEINNLKVIVLFFLGIYAQESSETVAFNSVINLINDQYDHMNYWIIEYLGRCATSRTREYSSAIKGLFKIVDIPRLYTSVVVRRKLFWEFYRIMKYIPHVSNTFFHIFEDGLVDSNPDVRLLATICLALANRIHNLTVNQIDKIISLFTDEEDDVRETAVHVIGALKKNHEEIIVKHINSVRKLLEDKNCHVQFAARETLQLIY